MKETNNLYKEIRYILYKEISDCYIGNCTILYNEMSNILYKNCIIIQRKLQLSYIKEVVMSYTWEIKQPHVVLEVSMKCEMHGTRWIKQIL